MNDNAGSLLFALIIFLAGFFIYLLPTLLALTFRRRQMGAIFVLNLLLGWTVIGWAAAMVWAFVKERE
jgi:hypothetical protein